MSQPEPALSRLQPGPGVGGHCIAVDPWFIVDSAPKQARLIRTAREVNDSKPDHVVQKVKAKAQRFRNPKIACFGLTFKANIDDLRESPAKYIAQKVMQSEQNNFLVVEPNIEEHSVFKLTDYKEAYEKADIIAFLVAHDEFKSLEYNEDKIILDFAGIFRR